MELREPDARYLISGRSGIALPALPEGWSVRALAEVAHIQSGIAKNANSSVSDPVELPYLRVANVQDGFVDLTDVATIRVSRDDLRRFAVRAGDVLMNEGGDLDKLGRGTLWLGQIDPCVHQNHVFVVRCRIDLLPEYLSVWSASATARRYFVLAGRQTTNLASINKTSLGELPVALPKDANEQAAIAAAVRDADALIESLEQLLAKKRQIRQGAMQELLTGKKRLSGFAGAWRAEPLASLFAFSGGLSASRDELGTDGIAYLHYGDIHLGTSTLLDLDAQHASIPKLDVPSGEVPRKAWLDDGDIVFVDASEDDEGTSKHVVVRNKLAQPFVAGLHTIVAKAKGTELDKDFRRYCFQSADVKTQFRFFAVGTKVAGVSKGNIGKITVTFPMAEEQSAIAAVLSTLDAELEALSTRLAKARALKQGMAQALLTGRIRLAPFGGQASAAPPA